MTESTNIKTSSNEGVFLNKLKQKSFLIKIVIVAIVLVLITGIMVIVRQHNSHGINSNVTLDSLRTDANNKPMVISIPDQLTDVQAKLKGLMDMVSQSNDKPNIQVMKTTIDQLNGEIEVIKKDESDRYTALMNKITTLSAQLTTNQKETNRKFNNLVAIETHKTCLSKDKLPFKVNSIDMINGREVVSVYYDSMVTPLEQDFSLAGWKLKSANYQTQTATFVNAKGICAQSNLSGSDF